MKFKRGVDPKGLSAPAWFGLWKADEVHKRMCQKEATCTSTTESKHSVERSKHYTGVYGNGFGNAFDLRTWHVDSKEFASRLNKSLGEDYVVIVEKTHIHVHFAPIYRD